MKNNNIYFSIICPIYNLEKFIPSLVNTITNQSYKKFEIIFINDGSTDDSLKILKKYIYKKKIKYQIINSKKNNGPGWARNKGIKASSYNWIAFLDGDDLWYKDKLKVIKQNILKFKKKNFFIHWEKFISKKKKNIILRHGRHMKKNKIKIDLYRKNLFSTSAVVLQKNITKNLYFNENLPNAQDYDFWLKISNNINDHTIKKVLGYYIDRKDSITSRRYFKKIPSLIYICFKYMNFDLRFFFIKFIKIIFSPSWIK